MHRLPARKLYAALLRLHPAEFQRNFASEMLDTYDEAVATFSPSWLLREAAASVLRQHLLRRPGDPVAADGAVGLISGVYPLMEPFELRAERVMLAVVITCCLLITVFPMGDSLFRAQRGPHVILHSVKNPRIAHL